jgi:hypothetical protein
MLYDHMCKLALSQSWADLPSLQPGQPPRLADDAPAYISLLSMVILSKTDILSMFAQALRSPWVRHWSEWSLEIHPHSHILPSVAWQCSLEVCIRG